MRIATVAVAGAATLAFLYYGFARSWMLQWGATVAEFTEALPGDEFVLAPRTGSTRAITVDAPRLYRRLRPNAVAPVRGRLDHQR